MIAAIVFGVAMATTLVGCCPPSEDLGPHCMCRRYAYWFWVYCNGVSSPEDLVGPMRSLATRRTKIFSLQLRDSSLQYLPHGVFEGTTIEKVLFTNSKIMSLSDSDVAFGGLEDTLVEIRASGAEYIASWDWRQLKNLKNLDLIDVGQIKMGAVDEPLPRLPKLTALGITNAGLTRVVGGAFAGLPGLRILSLKSNELTEIRRDMLPDPADRLLSMDLSDNRISSLPEDLFSGLPSIEVVNLDNNKFVTLTENPFSRAFRILNEFTMTGNPIRCDCRLRWLTDIRVPSQFAATCATPESLKGQRVSNLDIKQLWC